MAQALPDYAAPLFCLGGTIYPVPSQFDWRASEDVLLDAIRETRVAMTAHRWATRTPNRAWLDCECIDPLRHEQYLGYGLFSLTNTLMTLMPEAPVNPKQNFRIPFVGQHLRAVHCFVVMALASLPALDALPL